MCNYLLAYIFASIYLHNYLSMDTRRDVFQAIADPTRRVIISLLSNKSQNVGAISKNFEVSRQAISLHIKILEECNLITIRQQGRERICEVQLDKLQEVHAWVEPFRVFWTKKLSLLRDFVETEAKNNKT